MADLPQEPAILCMLPYFLEHQNRLVAVAIRVQERLPLPSIHPLGLLVPLLEDVTNILPSIHTDSVDG